MSHRPACGGVPPGGYTCTVEGANPVLRRGVKEHIHWERTCLNSSLAEGSKSPERMNERSRSRCPSPVTSTTLDIKRGQGVQVTGVPKNLGEWTVPSLRGYRGVWMYIYSPASGWGGFKLSGVFQVHRKAPSNYQGFFRSRLFLSRQE